MENLSKYIEAYSLKNAIDFEKADAGRILSKLFKHGLEKKDISKVLSEIKKTVEKINSLSQEQKLLKFKHFEKLIPEKKEDSHELPELKNPKNVVMRFEPSPSGPLHVGHSYVLALNNEYVKKYGGKLIIRISDTNPENIYVPAYSQIPEDANWLTSNNVSEVIIQSDQMKTYYKYFEELINIEKAYICTCDQEEFKKLLNVSKSCPCRILGKQIQKERWEKMFSTYKPGEAVARLKTDISNKNPAMRDFPLFRINTTRHPRQNKKFRVWPLMNMAVTVDDIESKVTHIIRGKDHVDNAKRQEIMYSYFKKKSPQVIFVGRINFLGMPVSCSKTREEIEKGKYASWDDIRLPFLQALKRRGFTPEALIKYALSVGLTLTDKTVNKDEFFKAIESFNREIIDSRANRYSFIANPVELKIKNAPQIEKIKVPLHPNKEPTREIKIGKLYISKEDLKKFRGEEVRLLHLYNVLLKDKPEFTSEENKKLQKINWISEKVNCEVLMPNGKILKGVADSGIKTLKYNEIVQFERFGFVRLDKMVPKQKFWFTHK